jgi:hypothetical protein
MLTQRPMIRKVSEMLKSTTSVTQALVKERAKDKKREEKKFKKFHRLAKVRDLSRR